MILDFNSIDALEDILKFLNVVPNRKYGDNYVMAYKLEKIIENEKAKCKKALEDFKQSVDERGANELYMEHFYENSKPKEKMSIEEIGKELSRIINQDGDDRTDGECIDEIIAYLRKNNLYIERK